MSVGNRSRITEMLEEFHSALNDPVGRGNCGLRYVLTVEENKELEHELRFPSDIFIKRELLAQELCDVIYIAFGTAHAFAIDLDVGMEEIHRAAMSKLGPNKVVRPDGKILKPKGFIPPDMTLSLTRES